MAEPAGEGGHCRIVRHPLLVFENEVPPSLANDGMRADELAPREVGAEQALDGDSHAKARFRGFDGEAEALKAAPALHGHVRQLRAIQPSSPVVGTRPHMQQGYAREIQRTFSDEIWRAH